MKLHRNRRPDSCMQHRVPILPATWFQDSWELSLLAVNHILFTERAEKKKRRVQIYDITKGSIHLLSVKYDAAIISGDGRYLLVGYGNVPSLHILVSQLIGTVPEEKQLSIINVSTEKTVKKFKTKGLHVRKWTSHDSAFCWVDNDGVFWSWPFDPSGGDPQVVFKLQANAPRYWLTPLASRDGSWVGICATEKDRRTGVVQLFPSDNSTARVFEGPAAAAFTEVPTERGVELAITLLTILTDARGSYVSTLPELVPSSCSPPSTSDRTGRMGTGQEIHVPRTHAMRRRDNTIYETLSGDIHRQSLQSRHHRRIHHGGGRVHRYGLLTRHGSIHHQLPAERGRQTDGQDRLWSAWDIHGTRCLALPAPSRLPGRTPCQHSDGRRGLLVPFKIEAEYRDLAQ